MMGAMIDLKIGLIALIIILFATNKADHKQKKPIEVKIECIKAEIKQTKNKIDTLNIKISNLDCKS